MSRVEFVDTPAMARLKGRQRAIMRGWPLRRGGAYRPREAAYRDPCAYIVACRALREVVAAIHAQRAAEAR